MPFQINVTFCLAHEMYTCPLEALTLNMSMRKPTCKIKWNKLQFIEEPRESDGLMGTGLQK